MTHPRKLGKREVKPVIYESIMNHKSGEKIPLTTDICEATVTRHIFVVRELSIHFLEVTGSNLRKYVKL